MKDVYVHAVLKAAADGIAPDVVLTNLRQVMERRGHGQLFYRVLQTVLRELTASRAVRTIVRVADETAYTQYQTEIKKMLSDLNCTDTPHVTVDPSLIGGYQVEANDRRVDASYKQLLTSLYRRITTH